MMFTRFFICLILFFTVLSNNAISFEQHNNIQYGRLSNGMEVYFVPHRLVPMVMHMVWYKVGSVNDPIGYSGLAHFVEHLMFRSTNKIKNVESVLNEVGNIANAMTSEEFTCYYEFVTKDKLSKVMELEADRMRNLKISQINAKKEQNIVLEERKMRIDNKISSLLKEEMSRVFYANGYGRPAAGWANEIADYDDKIASYFYNKYYHPNNAMLLVIGDTSFDEVMKNAEKYYGVLKPSSEIKRVLRKEPKHQVKNSIEIQGKGDNSELSIWYQAPSRFTGNNNYLPIYLMSGILGGGKSSILHNKLVVEKNIANSVYVNYDGMRYGDTAFSINVTPKQGISLHEVEDEVNLVIDDIIKNGISDEQLKIAKYKFKSEKLYNLDDINNMALFYGIHLILGVPIDEINVIDNNIDDVTVEDVNKVIKLILSSKSKLTGYLLPKEKNNVKQ